MLETEAAAQLAAQGPSLADQIAAKEAELDAANAAKDRKLAGALLAELGALEDQAAAQAAAQGPSLAEQLAVQIAAKEAELDAANAAKDRSLVLVSPTPRLPSSNRFFSRSPLAHRLVFFF